MNPKDIENFFEQSCPATACICAPVADLQFPLFPEETEYILKCVSKRRREFIAGRSAVRLAMKKLGVPVVAIPRGEQNEPIWPESLTGSISHTNEVCLCVIGSKKRYSAIGVDIEDPKRIESSLFPSIFSDTELKRLENFKDEELALHATALFSAKEAFFKLQHQLTHQWIGFKDVEVCINDDKIELVLVPKAQTKALLPKYHGLVHMASNFIVTGFFS